jgi:poly(3-hydroxybutyrate) depolymerase
MLGLCCTSVAVFLAGCTTCVGGTEPPRKNTARMSQRARGRLTQPATQTRELTVDGQKRSYLVQTPKNYSASKSYPLIVLLTAQGETPSRFSDREDVLGGAAKLGYLLAIPTAGPDGWSHGLCEPKAARSSAAQKPAAREAAAAGGNGSAMDVQVVDALLDELGKQYRVKATYLVGRGSGALLAQRVASEKPEKAAALVAVSSPADCQLDGLPTPKGGVPALIVDSAASPAVGASGPKGAAAPATESNAAKFWTAADGCNTSRTAAKDVERTDYVCRGGERVTHIRIVGLGDVWPHKIGKEFSMRTLDGFFREVSR